MNIYPTIYHGSLDNPRDVEAAASHDQARLLSNQALQAEAVGNMAQAIELHNQGAALKIRTFGEESVEAAVSLNGLGECYLQTGDLAKAEENLLKALRVRDDRKAGGLGKGDRSVAGCTVFQFVFAVLPDFQGHSVILCTLSSQHISYETHVYT